MSITITTSPTQVRVQAPFNRAFVTAAKFVGGRWTAPHWTFDVRDEDRVRDLCLEHYGEDGRSPSERVTIRVAFPGGIGEYADSIRLAGREVARAFGRDSGAKLGEGVILLSGKFDSGGSVKNWKTIVPVETIVLVRDVPRALADRLMADGGLDSEMATSVAIESEAPVIDRQSLLAERTRLVARIAEITSLLGAELDDAA